MHVLLQYGGSAAGMNDMHYKGMNIQSKGMITRVNLEG